MSIVASGAETVNTAEVVAKKLAASADAADAVDAASSRMHKAALEESTNAYGLVAAAEVAFFNFMMSHSMAGYFSTVNKTQDGDSFNNLGIGTIHNT